MNPETAPTVGEVVTITSDGKDLSGTILGRLNINPSGLLQRDAIREAVVLLTDTKNLDPFKRAVSFTFQSLLVREGFKDGEVVYTSESLQEANRVFDVSERLIPEEITFAGERLKSGQKIIIEHNGELVLMEANSVTYDSDGNALLLLTNPKYSSNSNFAAILTPEEFKETYFKVPDEQFVTTTTTDIKSLIYIMLEIFPDGIVTDSSNVNIQSHTTIEKIIAEWNLAVKNLPNDNPNLKYAGGLVGIEGSFIDTYLVFPDLGLHLIKILRIHQLKMLTEQRITSNEGGTWYLVEPDGNHINYPLSEFDTAVMISRQAVKHMLIAELAILLGDYGDVETLIQMASNSSGRALLTASIALKR